MPAPSIPAPDRLIGASEAARLIGVDRRTINRWSVDGTLGYRELPSGRRRYRRADVLALIREVPARSS